MNTITHKQESKKNLMVKDMLELAEFLTIRAKQVDRGVLIASIDIGVLKMHQRRWESLM